MNYQMILITRHKEDSAYLSSQLDKNKISYLFFPLTNFLILKKKLKISNEIFIITSVKAILFLKKNNQDFIKDKKFIVIGKKTSKQLKAFGCHNILLLADSSDELLKKIKQSKLQNLNLRYLSSNVYNKEFVQNLRKENHQVRVTRVYKTIPISRLTKDLIFKINNEKISSLVFYSQFSLSIFLKLCKRDKIDLRKKKNLSFYCFSERIASPAKKLRLLVFYPSAPSEEKLLKIIQKRAFEKINKK